MKLLFLDLAKTCGFAFGETSGKPKVWSSRLDENGPAIGQQCGELARQLIAIKRDYGVPDLVGVEHHMAPKAQPSEAIIVSSLMLRGTVHAIMGGVYGCTVIEPFPAAIRATVCGKPHAGDRASTKAMVVRTAQILGLIAATCSDDNMADAAVGWHYVASTQGGKWPGTEFQLTPGV